MAEPTRLGALFGVAERFRRSVNLTADFADDRALAGYILTPLNKAILARVADGLRPGQPVRSWSLTGPYGAGKSACLLFLAQTLAYPVRPASRAFLRAHDEALYFRLMRNSPSLENRGYAAALITAARQPLAAAILDGLARAAAPLPDRAARLRALRADALAGRPTSPDMVAHAVEETAQALQAHDPNVLGLLLIIDELGKALEYAALSPERTDIGLLQTLAELAARSEQPVIGLVTVLHQGFEHYAAGLSLAQQREWAKVQGRFEGIGYLESPGEMLGLIGAAIQRLGEVSSWTSCIAEEVEQAVSLDLLPSGLQAPDGRRILAACAPLHPTVALTLGPLFRSRLAQNERSLFAFLSSGEPYGFQEHLGRESIDSTSRLPFYRLDQLYDYVVAALGSGLYQQSKGKRWAEIDEALSRLPKETSSLEVRLVKTIGLLTLLGDGRYLRPSSRVLAYALADGIVSEQAVEQALANLVEWRIVIYRKFQDAYALWEGSDVDLDECLEQALAHVNHTANLATLLETRGELQPFLAKRHLHETGTLRYLAPWVVDWESLAELRDRPFGEADGAAAFILAPADERFEALADKLARFSDELPEPRRSQLLLAIPRETQGIREALEELLAWRWVAENTPALEGDRVARRELAARTLAARARLSRLVNHSFSLASAYQSCLWVWRGQMQTFATARALSSAISAACDHVYNAAPILKNELINRRNLSSAAAAARRALVERMLTRASEPDLGLESYPPEKSIYLSLLRASGLHRPMAGVWGFGPPPEDNDPCRVRPLWHAIAAFLASTAQGSRPVAELFDLLRQPPYGLREGALPIYLAAALVHLQAEVALYEEGTFVPLVQPPEFERLMRSPERFSVRLYPIDADRSRLLLGYVRLFAPEATATQATVLNAVRGLAGFALRLPRYAHLTRQLSSNALAVRQILLTAREPQPLLFHDLPAALGYPHLEDDPAATQPYLAALRAACAEMEGAYGRLLQSLQQQLSQAFHLPADLALARREIAQRVSILGGWVADLGLRSFTNRLAEDKLPDDKWLESVAAGVTNKPPASWNDADAQSFRAALADLASRLGRVEDVALAQGAAARTGRVLRLGITDNEGREARRVLRLAPDDAPLVQQAAERLEDVLDRLKLSPAQRLAALASLAQRLLQDGAEENDHD